MFRGFQGRIGKQKNGKFCFSSPRVDIGMVITPLQSYELTLFFLVDPPTHCHIIVFTTSFWPNALPPAPSPCTCLFISHMIFKKMLHHATIRCLSWSDGVVHFYQPSNHGKSHLQVSHCSSTRLHSCLRLSINST